MSRGHLGDLLSALLDGELSGPYEDAALAHLAGCPACAEELHAVRQARAWVRALPQVPVPFGFYERVVLDRRPVPLTVGTSLRRRAGVAALGAAAVAVTVLGVGAPARSPAVPAQPRLVEARATSVSVGADLLSKLAPIAVPVSFGR